MLAPTMRTRSSLDIYLSLGKEKLIRIGIDSYSATSLFAIFTIAPQAINTPAIGIFEPIFRGF
jgi:hypothetical protein